LNVLQERSAITPAPADSNPAFAVPAKPLVIGIVTSGDHAAMTRAPRRAKAVVRHDIAVAAASKNSLRAASSTREALSRSSRMEGSGIGVIGRSAVATNHDAIDPLARTQQEFHHDKATESSADSQRMLPPGSRNSDARDQPARVRTS
jgi:hypothetical protein